MSPEEQFRVLNTPDWLTAFREKVSQVFVEFATLGVRTEWVEFEVEGVPCRVTPGTNTARADIGRDANMVWMHSVVAPVGWFQPPAPEPTPEPTPTGA